MSAAAFGNGLLHTPEHANGAGLVLTHGAGGNCKSALLEKVASGFADAGLFVLRFDLAFRVRRAQGPPSPGTYAEDQASIREAVESMRRLVQGPVYMGGQSYGGRQATMLAAGCPGCADGLLLLSYPLHPPGKAQMRTQHFSSLHTPALFVQGSRDPFATPEEIRGAVALIPAPTSVVIVEGAGHDLKAGRIDAAMFVVEPFRALFGC